MDALVIVGLGLLWLHGFTLGRGGRERRSYLAGKEQGEKVGYLAGRLSERRWWKRSVIAD